VTGACTHCGTQPVRQWVKPRIPGAVTVEMALCDCDRMRCPHPGCKRVLPGLRVPARCPHCNGPL
jgi:hypothetical protein